MGRYICIAISTTYNPEICLGIEGQMVATCILVSSYIQKPVVLLDYVSVWVYNYKVNYVTQNTDRSCPMNI